MTEPAIRVVSGVRAIVGEAPLWSAERRALYWIDGQRRLLLRLRDGVTETRDLPYRPSCLAPLADGRLLVGYKKGIGTFDFDSGHARQLPLEGVDLGEVSFNDGACDRAGRLWIGTRHREARDPVAALYRFDPGFRATRVRDGIVLSNGIAFSPDGRWMYHADSRPGRVDAYDLDPVGGALPAPRVLVDYAGTGRRPDGLTVDAEGFLWVAEIDGSRVARYAPDGRLDRAVILPCRKPSSVAFGGPDLSTLFVTSISYGLTEEELAAQPCAGHVMALATDVAGLPEPPCHCLPEGDGGVLPRVAAPP